MKAAGTAAARKVLNLNPWTGGQELKKQLKLTSKKNLGRSH